MTDRIGFLLLGSILTPDKPLASSVTAAVPRPKMALGLTVVVVVPPTVLLTVPPLSEIMLAPALVLSVNLKLWLL